MSTDAYLGNPNLKKDLQFVNYQDNQVNQLQQSHTYYTMLYLMLTLI